MTSPPAGVQTPDCAFTAVLKCKATHGPRVCWDTHPLPRHPTQENHQPCQTPPRRNSSKATAPSLQRDHRAPEMGGQVTVGLMHSPVVEVGSWGPGHELRDPPGSAQPSTQDLAEPPHHTAPASILQAGLHSPSCYPPAKAACDGV